MLRTSVKKSEDGVSSSGMIQVVERRPMIFREANGCGVEGTGNRVGRTVRYLEAKSCLLPSTRPQLGAFHAGSIGSAWVLAWFMVA